MNARGEQIQGNENIKADLLSRLDDPSEKNRYGIIWEEWQDYFWKSRKSIVYFFLNFDCLFRIIVCCKQAETHFFEYFSRLLLSL